MKTRILLVLTLVPLVHSLTDAQWQDLSNPQLGNILQCKFVSPRNGWMICAGGTQEGLFRSTDGGETWTRVLENPSGTFNWLFGFDFLGDTLGYTGAVRGRNCYRTTNGGGHWDSVGCGLNPNLERPSMRILSASLAYYGGGYALNRSTDNCRSWQTISLVPRATAYSYPQRYFFLSRDTILACGGAESVITGWSGTIECYKSTDGGLTWGFPFVDTLACVRGGAFADRSTGYVFHFLAPQIVDVHYRTHKTTDGGTTWFQIPARLDTGEMYVTDAYFKNRNEGFVAGGQLARTSDGGLTWSTIPGTIGASYFSWVDSLHGWAVGNGGKIYRTTSGGWLPIQLASFTGHHLGGTRVRLEWRTLGETNNLGFYVERRRASDTTFTQISPLIPGYGTTNEPHDYSWTDSNATIARWYYRLKQVDLSGPVHYSEPILVDVTTGVSEQQMPHEFKLEQNYPNPFNPQTTIKFELSEKTRIKLEVLDILGRSVAVVVNEVRDVGSYSVQFDGGNLSSGVYLYRLTAGGRVTTQKMLLIR